MTDNTKAKGLSKEEIKTKLLDSMTIDEIVEFDDLSKEAEETQDPEEAAKTIKWCEDIIKKKYKGIINLAYHQGQVFKRFQEKEKFVSLSVNYHFRKPSSFLKLMFLICVKIPQTIEVSDRPGVF